MHEIEIDAGTLLFAADDLTATGLLVPFGVECNSSIGRFTVEPGDFTVPTDLTGMSVNTDHERSNPVGVHTAITETPQGLFASYKFADTPAGRQAYDDAKSGKRAKLSVEARNVIIKAGRAVSGYVFGSSLVEKGAFAGAQLLAAAADTQTVMVDGVEVPAHTEATSSNSHAESDGSKAATNDTFTEDVEELPDGTVRITRTTVTVTERTPAPADQQDPNQPNTDTPTEGDPTVGAASIPATLNAASHQTPTAPKGRGLSELNMLLAQAHRGDSSAAAILREEGNAGADLYAALSDIKGSAVGAAVVQPQWAGEAYNAGTFERRYVPLFAHDNLTGMSVEGFRWTTPPVMGLWAADKAAVPSAPVAITPTSNDAKSWAGAHDIDRRIRDFGMPEFWDGYWRHMSNSYRKLTDADTIATVVGGATPVVAGAVPAGVSQGAVSIVDGFIAIQDEGIPTFAVLAPDLWRSFILTPKDQTLEYLSIALGLDQGDFAGFKVLPARTGDIAAGKALVGIGQAATVYELPGSPLRVEGLDMVKGGIDPGAFGYSVAIVEDAAAFALVSPAA